MKGNKFQNSDFEKISIENLTDIQSAVGAFRIALSLRCKAQA